MAFPSKTMPKMILLCMATLLMGYLVDPSLAQDLECNTQDRDTLLRLKEKLGNPASLSSWNSTSDCCSSGWHGIRCKAGRVSSLQLMSLTDINGTIPPEIGRLTSLETLIIANLPGLRGQIPHTLGNLTNVSNLQFGNLPGLVGPIPDSVGSLTNLELLYISSTGISGQLPSSIGEIKSLMFLQLQDNKLTGHIPDVFGQLTGLSFVNLTNNQLSGPLPQSLTKRQALQLLSLSLNRFDFNLSLVEFPRGVQLLDLSHNLIVGSIPGELDEIAGLEQFDVSYNKLVGEIPQGGKINSFGVSSFEHNVCLCGHPYALCPCCQCPLNISTTAAM